MNKVLRLVCALLFIANSSQCGARNYPPIYEHVGFMDENEARFITIENQKVFIPDNPVGLVLSVKTVNSLEIDKKVGGAIKFIKIMGEPLLLDDVFEKLCDVCPNIEYVFLDFEGGDVARVHFSKLIKLAHLHSLVIKHASGMVSKELYVNTGLTELLLIGCKGVKVPDGIARLKKLNSFICTASVKVKLPEDLIDSKIKVLDITGCRLDDRLFKLLPDSIEEIYGVGNIFSRVDWDKLKNCRFINLRYNSISRLPLSLSGLSHVEYILLDDNSIESVDLQEIPQSLMQITLHENPLKHINDYSLKLINSGQLRR